jgi:ketosteroid isomerase-like protein
VPREAVRESWEQIFASTKWIRVAPTAVRIQVLGDVGLVACSENITTTSDGDLGVAVAQATNVFRRTPEGWRMVVHHASPAPVLITQPFSGTVQ